MSGDAGSHTINIKLDLNYTGEDRIAKINIIAGESTITITVEQKGTTNNGKTPIKVVSSMTIAEICDDGSKESLVQEFEYNEDYNVSK